MPRTALLPHVLAVALPAPDRHHKVGWTVELLAGATPDSLAPVTGTTLFTADGYFLGGTRILDGLAPGTKPFFQVRVWQNLGGWPSPQPFDWGEWGMSPVFQLGGDAVLGNSVGLPPTPPPALTGMSSFSLVPEPSHCVLFALGAALCHYSRRPVNPVPRRSSNTSSVHLPTVL